MRRSKRLLSVAMVATMLSTMVPLQAAAETAVPDPIVYLDFEEAAQTETIGEGDEATSVSYFQSEGSLDAKAKVHYGTSAVETDELRNGGSVLKFAGSNSLALVTDLSVNTISDLSSKDALTISWWENVTGGNGWAFQIKNYAASGDRYYLGVINNTTMLKIEKQNGSNLGANANPAPTAGWRHVAAVYDATGYKLYVNGVQVVNGTNNTASIADCIGEAPTFHIGRSSWSNGEYMRGSMDDFKVYDVALTAEQVAADMASTKGSELVEIESATGTVTLDDDMVVVANGTTVNELKAGLVVSDGATVTISADGAEVTDGVVPAAATLVVSKDGCVSSTYTAIVKEVTTATEDENTKTIVYAPSTLAKMDRTNNTELKNLADFGTQAFYLGGWGGGNATFGVSCVDLTEDNAANLTALKMNAKLEWRNSGNPAFGLVTCISETDTSSAVHVTKYIDTPAKIGSLTEIDLIGDNEISETAKVAKIYFGLGELYAGFNIKNVTATYNKTGADKKLDAAVALAQAADELTDYQSKIYENAKQYKISTTTDLDVAVLATQAQIQAAADSLTAAMTPQNVTVMEGDSAVAGKQVEGGRVVVCTSDEKVTWVVNDEVVAIGKKLRYTVGSGDVVIVARETVATDEANGIVVGDVAGNAVTITYGSGIAADATADFTFVTTDSKKATLADQAIGEYKGQTVNYTIDVADGIEIAYVYAQKK